ncbi:MAG: carboxymuconolactone decarboxylase family protein [Acidimicrobiales bacterium]
MSDVQLRAVSAHPAGPAAAHIFAELFDEPTCAALAYAEAMTSGDVNDALFDRVAQHFDADQIIELTEVVAWENASARFNRALRVPSQGLWRQRSTDEVT